MGTHVIYYCDDRDGREVTDVDYQCSYRCMLDTFTENNIDVDMVAGIVNLPAGRGSVEYGECPGGSETDYDVHCSSCEALLWKGLESSTE